MRFVSAIVPTIRSPHDLLPILTNLIAALPDRSEIVIVDDSASGADWEGSLRALGLRDNEREIPVRCLVNERNSGPGYARNVGIASAKGAYVCFVDDDDAIADRPFRNLRESDVAGCDVVLMGFRDTSGVMTADAVHSSLAGEGTFTADRLCARYLETGFLPLQCQAFLFDAAFLRSAGISFPATYLAEDVTFNVLALLRARRLRYIDAPYYVYNSRGGSLKSVSGLDRSYDFLLAAIYLADCTMVLSPVRADVRRATLRRLISLFFIRLCQVTDDPQLSLSAAMIAADHPWIAHLPEGDGFAARMLARLADLGGGSNSDLIGRIVTSLRSVILPEQAEPPHIYIYCTGPLGHFFVNAVFADIAARFVDDNPATVTAARAQGLDIVEGRDLSGALQAGDVVVIANIQSWIADQIVAKLAASCDPQIWCAISLHTPQELFDGLAELNRYLKVMSEHSPTLSY